MGRKPDEYQQAEHVRAVTEKLKECSSFEIHAIIYAAIKKAYTKGYNKGIHDSYVRHVERLRDNRQRGIKS